MKRTGREGRGRRLLDKEERGQEEKTDEGRQIRCEEDRKRRERKKVVRQGGGRTGRGEGEEDRKRSGRKKIVRQIEKRTGRGEDEEDRTRGDAEDCQTKRREDRKRRWMKADR